ncbi:anthranilate synthase component I [Agrococcus sediminis]|uniref:Anthranilate synthase component 1 n=1 Tax=Agrococcus sediminis TaxID=2599924 RepID=A0A5M8QFP1_9MICO|nr:anthranilate synthase component I [Agrococcus sediminis]KAA6433743.1 anthranilate synthase component I [Agrococcus sediminis]
MTGSTDRAGFEALLEGHRVVPVVREVFLDAETPVGVYRRLAAGRPGTFLLESAQQGVWNRYSFVGVESFGTLTADGDRVEWRSDRVSRERLLGDDAPRTGLETVEHVLRRWATPRIDGLPRLTSGLIGHIGWEAVRELERLPQPPAREVDVPAIAMSLAASLVVLDHRTGAAHLVANVLNDGHEGADALWRDAQDRLDALEAGLQRDAPGSVAALDRGAAPDARARVAADAFRAMVETSKRHIVDGDVFQVVLSARFDLETDAEPLEVYRVLRMLNPSPYLYLLSLEDADGGAYAVVGSSPEALVTVHDGSATMHPIAGSRPRGDDAVADRALADELLADPKERSEHVMLVDLARNDLAKVCAPGTVAVTELMAIERFSHIMHIVSTVEGRMREDATAVDAFRATFPAGTLSGAPKPRALELIDELEPAQRGVYGGVVGWLDLAGDADLAIAIRTVTMRDGVAHVQSGAGLVADSDPDAELQEVRAKAAAPLRAVAVASTMRHRP